MSTALVTTEYRGRGRFAQFHKRLHRADCRMLRADTRTQAYVPGEAITRRCGVCKPDPEQVAPTR